MSITESKTLNWEYSNKTVLCISDMHVPYHHEDSLDFLKAVKKWYSPDVVVSLGDLQDFHAISFHDSDPDLLSAGEELEAAREVISQLEKLFPDMYIVGSNHGDLPVRKFIAKGLPRRLLADYNSIYGVGAGWKFVTDLTIKSKKNIPDLYLCHNIKKNALAVAQQRGQRFVCGHYHEDFSIKYAGNPNSLLWAVMSGCLINPTSYAFAYNKLNLNRPILGTSVIENGMPLLIPMVLGSDGRWIGELL